MMLYPENHEDYWLSVSLNTSPHWSFDLRGWLPAAALSSSPADWSIASLELCLRPTTSAMTRASTLLPFKCFPGSPLSSA
jgi:hypothetical protein